MKSNITPPINWLTPPTTPIVAKYTAIYGALWDGGTTFTYNNRPKPIVQVRVAIPCNKAAAKATGKLNEEYFQQVDSKRFELPVCTRAYERESVCLHHNVLMGTHADMDMMLEAIRKIYDQADELK